MFQDQYHISGIRQAVTVRIRAAQTDRREHGLLILRCKTRQKHSIDDIDRLPCNVQWACPIYPAYVLTDGADGANAKGGNEDSAVLVPEFSFDDQTPPMCFVHGDADGYAAMGSVKTWEKLWRMGIQSDLHTLATRGHCFQMSA